MPPAPPEAGFSFSGISVTNASVVSMRAEIEAAFCSAVRVTLVGSTTPAFTRSSQQASGIMKILHERQSDERRPDSESFFQDTRPEKFKLAIAGVSIKIDSQPLLRTFLEQTARQE
jgi:hypothetical protein